MLRAEIIRRGQRIHKLTTQSGITPERAAELQAAELMVVRNDFWYWLKHYAWFADPKTDDPKQLRKIPLLLWPKQEELLRFLISGIDKAEDRTVNKSREIGATWLAAALIYWLSALAETREGFLVLAMSQKEKKVDDGTTNSIFGKIRFQHSMQPTFLRTKVDRDSYMMLAFERGGIIEGESTNTHAARSGRYAVVLSDEWAAVPRNKQRPIVNAMESVARSWWRISTPEGKGDDFHATVIHCRKYAPHKLIEIDWHADPRRTDAWYHSLLLENGGRLTWDERERNYNLSFAAITGLRIFKTDREKVTYTDAWLDATYPRARQLWPTCYPMDFGSGPSWTVCGVAPVSFDHGRDVEIRKGEKTRLPLILIDRELVWQRVSAAEVGQDILDAKAKYSSMGWHFGDPAGASAESDQESWESNLNAVGVPIACLPGVYNTHDLRDQSLTEAQMLFDLGLIRIHGGDPSRGKDANGRDVEPCRCPLLLESLESYQWAIPEGVDVQLVSRDTLKPLKNGWSHPADMLLYLVAAMLRAGREYFGAVTDTIGHLPRSAGAEASSMFDRMARDSVHHAHVEEDLDVDDSLLSVGIDWR